MSDDLLAASQRFERTKPDTINAFAKVGDVRIYGEPVVFPDSLAGARTWAVDHLVLASRWLASDRNVLNRLGEELAELVLNDLRDWFQFFGDRFDVPEVISASSVRAVIADLRRSDVSGALDVADSAKPPLPETDEPLPKAIENLKPCVQRAYRQWVAAVEVFRQSKDHNPTDRAAWRILHDHEPDEVQDFATWARYVREARRATGESLNSSRAGRSGRSVVKPSDL